MLNKVNEHQEQEIGELKRKNKELEDKVTKQSSNSEGQKKKKKKTKEAKTYNERSEAVIKAKTDGQAQVNESHRPQEEISRFKSRSMETLRPGSKYLVWLLPHCKS